jgi:hypothetical protein
VASGKKLSEHGGGMGVGTVFSPDGHYLAEVEVYTIHAVPQVPEVRIWNAGTGQLAAKLRALRFPVTGARLPNGQQYFASLSWHPGGRDPARVRIFDVTAFLGLNDKYWASTRDTGL